MVKKRNQEKKKQDKKKQEKTRQEKIFFVLLLTVLVLSTLNVAKAKGWLIPEADQIEVVEGIIKLDSLSLEQKIAQMVVVHGGMHNLDAWQRMQLGGIHLFAMEREDLFKETITLFQQGMDLPYFVTVDLEGCQNPFANFRDSIPNNQVMSVGEAFQKGTDDGKYLKELGFSINFAPVVDLDDEIWECRAFPGDEKEVAELAESYVLGLQNQGIIATAKHYPGKTLVVRDPHKHLVKASIDSADVHPYTHLFEKKDVKSVMVSHIIVSGEIDSGEIPSVVSPAVIGAVKEEYGGLVISDEINMLGLKNFYGSLDEMYIAVFKAGNDIVLNFNEDPNEIYNMIRVIAEAVERGEISQQEIDNSVTKILEAKGFTVS